MRLPPVPTFCRWYPRGDLSVTPYGALVTAQGASNTLNLTVFAPGSHVVKTLSGVRHKSDPWLLDHREHAYNYGVWDYPPPPVYGPEEQHNGDRQPVAAGKK